MNQMRLNLCVRELEQETKYINPHKQINLIKENTSFLIQPLKEEVKQLPKRKQKKLASVCKVLVGTCVLTLTLVNPTFAATPAVSGMLMPKDVMQIGMYIIGVCAAASTILAIVLSQASGIYRMMRKSKEATEWQTDILKGYTTTLLAPVLIMTIAFLMYLLFGNFTMFQKPF